VLNLNNQVGDDMRICVGEDVLPSGLKVREGTRMAILNTAIGRDPTLWSNPDTFEPERWMKYDANGIPLPLKRVDEYVHPIFFAGRRLCLGKDMARFETIVFMSKLFEELEILPQTTVKDPTYVMGPVIFISGGLPCTIKSRGKA
jgi:cytochrome P450